MPLACWPTLTDAASRGFCTSNTDTPFAREQAPKSSGRPAAPLLRSKDRYRIDPGGATGGQPGGRPGNRNHAGSHEAERHRI